jgi:hypothetical protein
VDLLAEVELAHRPGSACGSLEFAGPHSRSLVIAHDIVERVVRVPAADGAQVVEPGRLNGVHVVVAVAVLAPSVAHISGCRHRGRARCERARIEDAVQVVIRRNGRDVVLKRGREVRALRDLDGVAAAFAGEARVSAELDVARVPLEDGRLERRSASVLLQSDLGRYPRRSPQARHERTLRR